MPVFFSVEERDKKGKNMDEDGDADNGSPKNHIAKGIVCRTRYTFFCSSFFEYSRNKKLFQGFWS